jgi:hypothetical protein
MVKRSEHVTTSVHIRVTQPEVVLIGFVESDRGCKSSFFKEGFISVLRDVGICLDRSSVRFCFFWFFLCFEGFQRCKNLLKVCCRASS